MERSTVRLVLAWVACLAICAAVEAALHVAPGRWLLAYDQRSMRLTQSADYVNMRRAVVGVPPPQICIIGSSRARAIMSVPTIRRVLQERGFPDVDIRVYAGPNLNAAACLALVRLMRDQGHVPTTFIYAVEPRQLADCRSGGRSYAVWLCDLPSAMRGDSPVQIAGYDVVKRLAATWADLSVRSLWLRELVRLQPAALAQVLGGYSGDQVGHMMEKEENSLSVHPAAYSDLQYAVWTDECEARRTPSLRQRSYTESALDLMREIARPVVVELPIPESTLRAFPRGYYGQVIAFYQRACRKRDIPFLAARDVGFAAEERCFSNATHANWTGARLYSELFAEKVVVPILQKGRKGERAFSMPPVARHLGEKEAGSQAGDGP